MFVREERFEKSFELAKPIPATLLFQKTLKKKMDFRDTFANPIDILLKI